jgi:Glycine cleavage system protein P (pyridoxal-binding), C-terminal domain
MAIFVEDHFPILYRGENFFNAHEFMRDLRPIRKESGITEEEIAKRLRDYGFHAPTMSGPVPGTLRIEPTESESKNELDRFCSAMISIKKEIKDVIEGKSDAKNNMLKNSPHTMETITKETGDHPYTREEAVFPALWLREYKYGPTVGRIEKAMGDRNLICTGPDISEYEEEN